MCGSIGIKYLLVHAYRNHIIVENLDCDFVRVRMVTFLSAMGVEWLEHAYFVLNVRCSG